MGGGLRVEMESGWRVENLAPIPILVEPKKFHSIVDTEGILKKVWGKKSVGQIFVFFDM